MRALNFGSLNIDRVYGVDHAVRPGETLAASSLQSFCGGKGLNQSVALARAGLHVFHAGNVGTDGKMLTDKLTENGIDTSFVNTVDGASGHAIIQVDGSGQNSIFVFGGANKTVTEKQIFDTLSYFGDGDMLFLQNETNGIKQLITTAAQRGIPVVFNPSPFSPELSELPLDKLTWLVVNETEANGLTGEKDAECIIKAFARKLPNVNILLTLGENGSVCRFNGEIYRQMPFAVEAVDTTAAGDTFTGYFFASLGRLGIAKALRLASAAAAISISRNGAADSVPFLDETEKFLNAFIR